MNQKEFAAKIGISPATLNYYCKQKGMLEGQTGIEPEKCYDWFMKTGRTDMAAKVRKAFKFGAEKKVVELDKNVSKPRKVSVDETHPFHSLIKLLQDNSIFKFVLSGTVKDRQKVFEVFDMYFKHDLQPFPVGKKVYCVVNKDTLTVISKKAYKECAFSEYFFSTDTFKEKVDSFGDLFNDITYQDLIDSDKKIVVHLSTRDQIYELNNFLGINGTELLTGRSYSEVMYDAFGGQTCFSVADSFYNSLRYFNQKGYKVVPFGGIKHLFVQRDCLCSTPLHHHIPNKKDRTVLKEIHHFPEGCTAHPLLVRVNKIEELGRRFESFMVLLRELVSDIE